MPPKKTPSRDLATPATVDIKDVNRALSWLKSLCNFCDELEAFVRITPYDHPAEELIHAPVSALRGAGLDTLASSGEDASDLRTYMHDIPGGICQPVIMHLHCKACSAFRAVAAHPVMGVFRPEKTPFFFEKTLSICMAVGVQHIGDLPSTAVCGGLAAGSLGGDGPGQSVGVVDEVWANWHTT